MFGIFLGFLVSFLGDFNRFLGSGGFFGSPVSALGLPWGPNVTPRRSQEGLGEDLGSILESLGDPRRGIFHKKMQLFSDPVLGGLLGPLFK